MGLYSDISKRLQMLIEQGKHIADKRELLDGLDASDVSRDRLEHIAVEKAFAAVLNRKGFRSVVRGEGYYADYKKLDNPVFLHQLLENSKIDAKKKRSLARAFEKMRDKSLEDNPEYAQTYFDFDENGNVVFGEELTVDDIIEMLEKEA